MPPRIPETRAELDIGACPVLHPLAGFQASLEGFPTPHKMEAEWSRGFWKLFRIWRLQTGMSARESADRSATGDMVFPETHPGARSFPDIALFPVNGIPEEFRPHLLLI